MGQHDHLVAQHHAPPAVQRRTPASLASVPAAFAAIQRSAGNRAATALAVQRQAGEGALDVQRIACTGGNCSCAGCGGGAGEEKQQGEGS